MADKHKPSLWQRIKYRVRPHPLVPEPGYMRDDENHAEVVELPRPMRGYKVTDSTLCRVIIPEGAKVVYPAAVGKPMKLRADKVYIEKMRDISAFGTVRWFGAGGITRSDDCWHSSFDYEHEVGTMSTEDLDTNVEKTCASGIHFFRTRKAAVKWYRGRP